MKVRLPHLYAYPLAYEIAYGRNARQVAQEVLVLSNVLEAAKLKGFRDFLELGSGPKSKYEKMARLLFPDAGVTPAEWVTVDREGSASKNHVKTDFFLPGAQPPLPGTKDTITLLPYYLLQTLVAENYATPSQQQLTDLLKRCPGTIVGHVCLMSYPEAIYSVEKNPARNSICRSWLGPDHDGLVEERLELTVTKDGGKRSTLVFDRPFIYNYEAAIRAVQTLKKVGRKVQWYLQEEGEVTPIRGRPREGVPGNFWYVVNLA